MMAFGKDFGGMSKGNNKTGQKGTNAMFIMLPSNISNIPKNRVVSYVQVVIDHRPQKADPNKIRITAGGNLINYPGKLTTWTANITMAKPIGTVCSARQELSIQPSKSKTFTFPPRLTNLNTCAFLLPNFPHGLSNNVP